MANINDVAAFIIEKAGPMTAMKLQKLAYYAQSWHLVWEERPLFGDRIEAWANGPVVRSLYDAHKGRFTLDGWPEGESTNLDAAEVSTIEAVLDFYGSRTAHELSELTHREQPWRDARVGIPIGTRSNAEITHASMFEYYDGLTAE